MEFAIICGMVIGFGVIDRIQNQKQHAKNVELVTALCAPEDIVSLMLEGDGEEDEEDEEPTDWDEAWKRQHDKIHGNDNYTDPERNYQIWKREQEKRKRKGERDET